jgi:chemotaxis protein methyltransferase CheR
MPITHFYRDRSVFHQLETEILPELAQLVSAQPERELRCWSTGCASGEEPYTLSILWKLRLACRYPALRFRIVATDIDLLAIQRAQRACYHWSSLKELPVEWRTQAFSPAGDELCLREEYRTAITFLVQDLRENLPEGLFELILCRNLAFTYFDEASQRETLRKLAAKLTHGGVLLIGKLESLPVGEFEIKPWLPPLGVYRKPFVQAAHLAPISQP